MRVFGQLKRMLSPRGRHRAVPHRRTYRLLIATGLTLVTAVAAWQIYATVWTTHSERVGRALVNQFLKNRSLSSPVTGGSGAGSATLASCDSTQSSDPVRGLLEIPKLNVVAPVEDGTGDEQLNVAVGHDPYSVWPGQTGNAVLEAHDVSYFVGIPQLVAGDRFQYVSPCTTYTFQVNAHTVVSQGAPVYNTPGPSVTLVTCWPTNALWFTPDRYLVTADLVGQSSTGGGSHKYLAASAAPTVPVPADLAAQGVTLATYSLPMGSFTLQGTPDPDWAQSTNPLLVETSAVEAYIAGVRSLTEKHLDWWHAIAPSTAVPQPLVGAGNPSYLSALDVTVTANGSQATSVVLTNAVSLSGGTAPGHYNETVTESVQGGTLVITGWTMQLT